MRKITTFVILAFVLCFSLLAASPFLSMGQITPKNFVTLIDSKSCQSLVRGQDSIAAWSLNTCTLTGSGKYSPVLLTNSSTQLTIDSTASLVLFDGLGFASYGAIINNGKLLVNSALINYGILTNGKTGTITVNTLLLSMNVSAIATKDSGIVNNSGTLQVNKNAFLDNGNLLVNLGTLTNGGTIYNYISGINYSASIVNSGTIQGVAVKTSTNVAVQLNTTVTAKTTIQGCASC